MHSGRHDWWRPTQLAEANWNQKRVLVVGDVILDKYVHGNVERISPEAPVPVVLSKCHSRQAGGAANVAMNIACLGARAMLAGFTGYDKNHDGLQKLLASADVESLLIQVPGIPTTSKLR